MFGTDQCPMVLCAREVRGGSESAGNMDELNILTLTFALYSLFSILAQDEVVDPKN